MLMPRSDWLTYSLSACDSSYLTKKKTGPFAKKILDRNQKKRRVTKIMEGRARFTLDLYRLIEISSWSTKC